MRSLAEKVIIILISGETTMPHEILECFEDIFTVVTKQCIMQNVLNIDFSDRI